MEGGDIMSGFKKVQAYTLETKENRTCKCGKGKIITDYIVTEESDYPPFDRGYDYTYTTCPDNCEKCINTKPPKL